MLTSLRVSLSLSQSTLRHFRSYSAKANKAFRDELATALKELDDKGIRIHERVIKGPMGPELSVSSGKFLNFCANNYLGLANNLDVIKAGKEALDKFGAGSASVRFICGTNTGHKELEEKIAKFHQRDDAVIYPSCFDANAGLFETILSDKDVVLSDALNHASVIDGIRLCKAKKMRYNHNDMNDLEEKLKQCGDYRKRMIVTDGVFSMDGEICKLPRILELADKYDCITFLDEAHGTGVIGKTGKGTEEYYGTLGKNHVTIINSTLGKALGGGSGGYTTGPQELVDLIRNKSRSYLFTNTLPPASVASASKAFDIILNSSELVEKVRDNANYFRSSMEKTGYKLLGADHPVCPVLIGEGRRAVEMSKRMMEEGIYVSGFGYPIVPEGTARVRVQITAAHNKEQIDRLVSVFGKLGKEMNLI